MARGIPAKEVLRLRSSNLVAQRDHRRAICVEGGVSVVLRAAAEHDVAWEEAEHRRWPP